MLFDDVEKFCAGYRVWPVFGIEGKSGPGWKGSICFNGQIIGTAADLHDDRGANATFPNPALREPFLAAAKAAWAQRFPQLEDIKLIEHLFLDDLANLSLACKPAATLAQQQVVLARSALAKDGTIVPEFELGGTPEQAKAKMAADPTWENVTARLRIYAFDGAPRQAATAAPQPAASAPTQAAVAPAPERAPAKGAPSRSR